MIKHQIKSCLENTKQVFSIKFISVLIISFPSAIIADYFNIPLAWFLGPMIITSIAALSGLKIIMPKIVLSFILIILGLHIGNYIDQNLFNQMLDWIWTSLIMLIYIIICILVVAKYLQKFESYGEKASMLVHTILLSKSEQVNRITSELHDGNIVLIDFHENSENSCNNTEIAAIFFSQKHFWCARKKQHSANFEFGSDFKIFVVL